MCIIIDANMFGVYSDHSNSDMVPVRKWVEGGKGKVAYSPTAELRQELQRSSKMAEIFRNYAQIGMLKLVSVEKVQVCMNALTKKRIRSNDPHVIALAQVSGATLLATNDSDLEDDFKNTSLIKRGSIYKNKTHAHLLRNRRCP